MGDILFSLPQANIKLGAFSLGWRHNGRDSVSNHQPHHCLLNRLFRRRSKKASKLRVTGLCAVNSPHKWPVTRKMFPVDDVVMLGAFSETTRQFIYLIITAIVSTAPIMITLYNPGYSIPCKMYTHPLQWRQWAWWHFKSPALWCFTQPFIQGADQRKHQSSASLAFVRGIHRRPVNSPHKGPVTRKVFPFDDVIMDYYNVVQPGV